MLEVLLYIASVVLGAVLFGMACQIVRASKRYTPSQPSVSKLSTQDLPSVSVCIPARNEQHALADCLQRVLQSTYEKLEIIVLDDVSVDKTPALIKSFASEGVRFVEGPALTPGWLGKNHALQGLLNEASGAYILYLDVDTLLAPQAIENMVTYALQKEAAMVSVLPRREDMWRASVLASPLRYFWELIFARRLWPATASNAWLIRRDILQKRFDGLKSFKATVQPEAKIATELAQTNEYRFLISTARFGVTYEKKWRSQLATSIRLLYPLLGRQVALAIMAALDLTILLIPFIMVWLFLSGSSTPIIGILGTMLSLGFMALYGFYTSLVWNKGRYIGALLWPLIVIQEILLVIASTTQHLRGKVTWKGRSVAHRQRPSVK